MRRESNYDKFPIFTVSRCGSGSWEGWPRILERLEAFAAPEPCTISLECYPGVLEKALISTLVEGLRPPGLIVTSDLLKSPSEIELMVSSVLGDDPVFGRMNGLKIEDFFDSAKLASAREQVKNWQHGLLVIVGVGASLLSAEPDLLVYADMARWEIQQRQRRNVVGNLGADNLQESPGQKYKRAFFVDWRAADHLKKSLLEKIDFWLDTNGDIPKLVTGRAVRDGLKQIAHRPFRVVPYFDPGPWGGPLDGGGLWPSHGDAELCLVFRLCTRGKQFAACFRRNTRRDSSYEPHPSLSARVIGRRGVFSIWRRVPDSFRFPRHNGGWKPFATGSPENPIHP